MPVSQYNYDDIEYFIRVESEDRSEELKSKIYDLEYEVGFVTQWIISEKTYNKIKKQLNGRIRI